MTSAQQAAALIAIRQRQDNIGSCINSNTSPAMMQHITKWLEDLEGAYAAIDAIETVGVRRLYI